MLKDAMTESDGFTISMNVCVYEKLPRAALKSIWESSNHVTKGLQETSRLQEDSE